MDSKENLNHEEGLSPSKSVAKRLTDDNFDTSVDYLEIAIDTFVTEDGIAKEIPGVKTAIGLFKTIREAHFERKLLAFMREFHSDNLPKEKMTEFRIKFEDDEKYRNKVIDQIVIYIDRFIEDRKSIIFANLFLAHLNSKIDWAKFQRLTNIVERIELQAIDYLHELAEPDQRGHPFSRHNLRDEDNVPYLIAAGVVSVNGTHTRVTKYGQLLYYYGVRGDINTDY